MNSSFSKKRHIFEANQRLEQRFLHEQTATEDPTQTGFRADRGQLPPANPAPQPAAVNTNPYGYDEKTGKGKQIGQETNPYGYDEKTGKGKQIGQEINPYGYDEKTGKGMQLGTTNTATLKPTHELAGDRSYQYAKDSNGNWFALRLTDKKWIDLKNNPGAIDKLNKSAITIGSQPANKNKQINKSTQTGTDTTTSAKQASDGGAVNTNQPNNNTTAPAVDNSKLFMTKNMIDKELSDFNTDEKYVAGLISQLNQQEFDALIKSYGGLQGMTTKFFNAFKGVQDRAMLDQALRRFGYKYDFANIRGNGGKIIKNLMITKI